MVENRLRIFPGNKNSLKIPEYSPPCFSGKQQSRKASKEQKFSLVSSYVEVFLKFGGSLCDHSPLLPMEEWSRMRPRNSLAAAIKSQASKRWVAFQNWILNSTWQVAGTGGGTGNQRSGAHQTVVQKPSAPAGCEVQDGAQRPVRDCRVPGREVAAQRNAPCQSKLSHSRPRSGDIAPR